MLPGQDELTQVSLVVALPDQILDNGYTESNVRFDPVAPLVGGIPELRCALN